MQKNLMVFLLIVFLMPSTVKADQFSNNRQSTLEQKIAAIGCSCHENASGKLSARLVTSLGSAVFPSVLREADLWESKGCGGRFKDKSCRIISYKNNLYVSEQDFPKLLKDAKVKIADPNSSI